MQQYGCTLGGPIVRNKAHFFGSVERVLIDDAHDHQHPRAARSSTPRPPREDRVWNTVVRFDHQINPSHTWNVRWLRETRPSSTRSSRPVIAGANSRSTRPPRARRTTWTRPWSAQLNSAFGNTRFNTLRVGFTQEDVAFANPAFNANGQRRTSCPPTLQPADLHGPAERVAQARVNNAYQIEDTLLLVHARPQRRPQPPQAGVQYEYIDGGLRATQDNRNGMFTFRTDRRLRCQRPRDLSRAPAIRVPGPAMAYQKEHYFAAFVQDKWQLNDRLTLSLGRALRPGEDPHAGRPDNPAFTDPEDYPVDTNNIAPRLGFAYDWKGDGKTVLRGGVGRFYDKTHFELIAPPSPRACSRTRSWCSSPPTAPIPGPRRASSRATRCWSTARP